MRATFRGLARPTYVVIAIALIFSILVPFFTTGASAAQVQSRSIEMSNAAAGVSSVSYQVSFKPQTNIASGGAIVVDICDNDPIIGDTSCTLPTGFDWGGATPTLAVGSGMGSGWTAAGVQGGAGSGKSQVLELTSTGGTLTGGTQATFTISTVTNPSTANHSFYARILTFDTAAHMTSEYTTTGTTRASSLPDMKDYGGVALSTSQTITITAKVIEQLTFCVSGALYDSGSSKDISPFGGSNNCASTLSTPSLQLGHDNGNGTIILDSTAVDSTAAYTQVSSNAASGVVVRMKATNTCSEGGLTAGGGTCAIPGVGGRSGGVGSGNAITNEEKLVAGTAEYGLCISPGDAQTAANEPYADDSTSPDPCLPAGGYPDSGGTDPDVAPANANTYFGMDNDSLSTGVISTYGSSVYHTTGPVSKANDVLVFAATASNTTPAGIYTGGESLIATGTF